MAMIADNKELTNAVNAIGGADKEGYAGIAADFKAAGENFISDLTKALDTFEGETKDALMSSKIGSTGSETEGTLAMFVEKQIPDLIKGLASLLEGNRATIEDSDKKLAEAIKGGGQG